MIHDRFDVRDRLICRRRPSVRSVVVRNFVRQLFLACFVIESRRGGLSTVVYKYCRHMFREVLFFVRVIFFVILRLFFDVECDGVIFSMGACKKFWALFWVCRVVFFVFPGLVFLIPGFSHSWFFSFLVFQSILLGFLWNWDQG